MDSWAGNHRIGICNLPKIPPETLELLGGKNPPSFPWIPGKSPKLSQVLSGWEKSSEKWNFPIFCSSHFPFSQDAGRFRPAWIPNHPERPQRSGFHRGNHLQKGKFPLFPPFSLGILSGIAVGTGEDSMEMKEKGNFLGLFGCFSRTFGKRIFNA